MEYSFLITVSLLFLRWMVQYTIEGKEQENMAEMWVVLMQSKGRVTLDVKLTPPTPCACFGLSFVILLFVRPRSNSNASASLIKESHNLLFGCLTY